MASSITKWLRADFSWEGLATKHLGKKENSQDIQAYLRAADGGVNDETLRSEGKLFDHKKLGTYHVLFIPRAWVKDGSVKGLSEDDLLAARLKFHSEHGNRLATSFKLIRGFVLDNQSLKSVTPERFVNLDFVLFDDSIHLNPSDNSRRFSNCIFLDVLRFAGSRRDNEPPPELEFVRCDFGAVEFDQFNNKTSVKVTKCKIEALDLASTRLLSLEIANCQFQTIAFARGTIISEFSIVSTTVGTLDLFDSTFEGDCSIIETGFSQAIKLRSCDFRRRVTFFDIAWPRWDLDIASTHGTKFFESVTLDSESPPPVQLFDDARFQSGIALGDFGHADWRRSFEQELAIDAIRDDADEKEVHVARLETSCRNLRRIAEQAGDVNSGHFWHRAELLARRNRQETKVTERLLSFAYGVLADYGLSIARPFLMLTCSIALFALLYAYVGGEAWSGAISLRSLEEGLGFSLNRTLPIGLFGHDQNSWRAALIGDAATVRSIGIRSIATLQTIISTILIYLGVMAVRRKFKIS
jgi:hypothetical protein